MEQSNKPLLKRHMIFERSLDVFFDESFYYPLHTRLLKNFFTLASLIS